jgi:hypothetical protein
LIYHKNKKIKTSMYKNKLNQIKVVLGLQVKLASDKLVDGTVIEAENFEPGFDLFVMNEDGTKSPAPAGTHETETGLVVEVDQEGKIVSVTPKETEAPEVEVEVEAAAEDSVPASQTPEEIAKEESKVDPNLAEAMKKLVMAVEEISSEMAKMKTKMSEMESKYEKFSKTAGGSKFPKVTKEAFSEAIDPVEAKIAALQELKKENFFKAYSSKNEN